jgi:hypothetical protein
MTLLVVLLLVWLVVSPLLALLIGACIKAGRGPRLHPALRALPDLEDGSSADRGPRAATSPLEDLAA